MLDWIKRLTTGTHKPVVTAAELQQAVDKSLEVGEELLILHNVARAGGNLSQLTHSRRLTEAAMSHAIWMANNRSLSHYEGRHKRTAIGPRVAAVQYAASMLGENVACGFDTARDVFTQWIESPPHKLNIMTAKYLQVGFGFALNTATTTLYWCAIFARPTGGLPVSDNELRETLSGPLQAPKFPVVR